MKRIILYTLLLLVFSAVETHAQDKIIRSKYGLTVYPVKTTSNLITVYPNPVASFVSFKSVRPLAGFNVEVFDKSGISCVKKERWTGEKLDVSRLQAGIYIVKFTKGKEHYSQKLAVGREMQLNN
ncbi:MULTISPECIES: T9SS type A sorting domain-containing protein [Dyadobacter]|uniref:T9SS type A sorting domain-containing protein n=1 Tax=Dyadobacter chenhuakuii TaxID=2909339 RepID=A0A9X1QIE8_9BACT|nr:MULTISPECIES: T9SS type A sorting domain-containing protein [Dyadobacter]MCE7069413.1 T9SS type A sorting domain-containing protein [Dyadobacter sp. CY327]MCF2501419.1 T9SS type A sorting domain-containing protein [Dyadobacter chenhuakuii]